MNQTAIFWPMLAQVLLVFIVYGVLMTRRGRAVRSRAAKIDQFKDRSAEPVGSTTAANNLANQYELPVLFYAACLALYATTGVSYWTLVLAWIFTLSRYVHAFVHLTFNVVPYRTAAFAFGVMAVLLMWISFALNLLRA